MSDKEYIEQNKDLIARIMRYFGHKNMDDLNLDFVKEYKDVNDFELNYINKLN